MHINGSTKVACYALRETPLALALKHTTRPNVEHEYKGCPGFLWPLTSVPPARHGTARTLSVARVSAPARSSTSAASLLPLQHALCSGVCPSCVGAWGVASEVGLTHAALHRGVWPSFVGRAQSCASAALARARVWTVNRHLQEEAGSPSWCNPCSVTPARVDLLPSDSRHQPDIENLAPNLCGLPTGVPAPCPGPTRLHPLGPP